MDGWRGDRGRRVLVVVASWLWAGSATSASASRLVLEPARVVVDQAVWICVDRAPRPRVVHLDGLEQAPPALRKVAAGGDAPRPIHLVLAWPARGPLAVLASLDPRERSWGLPGWEGGGYLGPGEYVVTAEGFEPETLFVRAPDAAENRARALLARARRHVAGGDSLHAARLIGSFLALEEESPFREQGFLALLDLLSFSPYRDQPRRWLAEWVARHHSSCIVGEGVRRWLDSVEPKEARRVLAELVAGYPQSRAAREARDWLRAGPSPTP